MDNIRVQTPGQYQPGTTSGSPLLLQFRVDALNVSHVLQIDPQIERELQFASDRAHRTRQAQAFYVHGSPFELSAIGGRQQKMRLCNTDATLILSGDPLKVVVEIRAMFLATNCLSDVLDTIEALARHFTTLPILERRVDRLDLCADVTNVNYDQHDLDHFVGRARNTIEYFPEAQAYSKRTANGREPTGFYFSKGNPTLARLYNKTEELSLYPADSEKVLTELTAYRAAGWDGHSPLWRLEGQLRGEALRSMGITDPTTLPETLDGLWGYLFAGNGDKSAWPRLTVPGSATRRERCRLDPRWQVFSQVDFKNGNGKAIQRIAGRRRGLSVAEVTGALLSHLGGTGLLLQPRTGSPLEQLEQDAIAFLEQAKTSLIAEDYPARLLSLHGGCPEMK